MKKKACPRDFSAMIPILPHHLFSQGRVQQLCKLGKHENRNCIDCSARVELNERGETRSPCVRP